MAKSDVYVATVDGESFERVALTPEDHVNFAARGWVLKGESSSNSTQKSASSSAAPAAQNSDPASN